MNVIQRINTAAIALLSILIFSSNTALALPVCESADSDSDGDGYGWENNASCIVDTITSLPVLPDCQSSDSDPDGDGYGWENNQSCIVTDSNPYVYPICEFASSDPDGDGYGWENNATCLVDAGPTPNVYPDCLSPLSDPDGDGYGWENNATCIVNGEPQPDSILALSPIGTLTTGTPTFQWTALDSAETYRIVVRDSEGNQYAYNTTAANAGCDQSSGSSTCEATPDLAYYDNDLSWWVESSVNDTAGPVSNALAITTPVSIDIQPIKSNTGECEAWPAVAYDKYVVLNNSWNSDAAVSNDWQQLINVEQRLDGTVVPGWSYDWLAQNGDDFEVKSYPEIIYGSKLGTHVSGSKAETGLPELVKNLPEFTIEYAFTETGNAERNVALESFFHDSCNITGPCDEVDNRAYEMMIWVQKPDIRTPGDLALSGVEIDGRFWDVYIKPRSNKHYIAFVAQNPQSSGTLHWNRFVDWTKDWTAQNATALDIDPLSEDFCMGAIELGTETWWGEGEFSLQEFDVSFEGDSGDNTSTDFSTSGPRPTVLRTSALTPVRYAPTDTCLTLQDAVNGDFHGPIELGDFLLSTNVWNYSAAGLYPWEQCIYAAQDEVAAGWTYEWGAGGGSSDYEVRSYPELIYGVKSPFEISRPKAETGLPVRLDDMPYISIDYRFESAEYGPARAVDASVNPLYPNGTIINGERNIAIESFLHPSDANGECPASVVQRSSGVSNHTYEVMLWLDSGAERLPASTLDFVADVKIDGELYKVYTKINDTKYVAFVAQDPRSSGAIYWNSFIEWARLYAHRVQEEFGARTNSVEIQDTWCMVNILVGTEIWWGDGEFNIMDWEITQTE